MALKIDLKGRYALVTGGAGGIGYEFAESLARKGMSLILVDISEERLADASSKLLGAYSSSGIDVKTLALDLSRGDIIEIIDSFCKEQDLCPIVLINNAGIFSFSPVTQTDSKKIELFVDLHVRAVTLLSRWFCSLHEGKRDAWLLNMSSMSCWMPMPGLAMYASTKSYIRVFTRALHYELRGTGVNVMVACPGGIATDLFGLPENLKKFAVGVKVLDTPQKFVEKALRKLFKGKKQYINGLLNRFSIFFIGVMPTCARMQVKKRLLDKGITR